MKNNVITIENISFSYDSEPVLKNINMEIYEKDFAAVIGPNGGGKTTLLKIIAGLLKPSKGSLTIPEKFKIGYVQQHPNLNREFPVTVEDVVLSGTVKNFSLFPFFNSEVKKKANELMAKLELISFSKMQFGKLSGGQKQKTLIARALIDNPDIILLDEPVANVDSIAEDEIYSMLRELNEEKTIVMVSHDISFVSSAVKKVFCVNKTLELPETEHDDGSLFSKYNKTKNTVIHKCGL